MVASTSLSIISSPNGPAWVLAFLTLGLVIVTAYYMGQQVKVSKSQMMIEVFLKNRERYDDLLVHQRKLVAIQVESQTRLTGDVYNLSEEVANFFEDLGMQFRYGYLDGRMIWDVFSHDIIRWWLVHKQYIILERKRNNNDESFFSDFEKLAEKMLTVSAEKDNKTVSEITPSKDDLKIFVKSQMNLL